MLPLNKYNTVNWASGMKMSKNHFLQLESWMIDSFRDLSCTNLTDFNYGLLPSTDEENSSFKVFINLEHALKIQVKVLSCRALTRGGARIEITPFTSKSLNLDSSIFEVAYDLQNAPNQQYDIILAINPFQRVPVGDPDPEEHPLRYPFTLPTYSLDVVPTNHINSEAYSSYYISIGRFRVTAGEIQLEKYIPPCASIQSHQDLGAFFYEFERNLSEVKDHLITFIKRTRTNNAAYGVNKNILTLAESMLRNLVKYWDEFRLETKSDPPIKLFGHIVRLVRLLSTELSMMPEDERLNVHGVLNRNVTAGTFEAAVSRILSVPYQHRDLYKTFSELLAEFRQIVEQIKKLPYAEMNAQPKYEPEAPKPEAPKEEKAEQSNQPSSGPAVKIVKIMGGGK